MSACEAHRPWIEAQVRLGRTVVANCKLVGVNPENYIAWVLPKLAAATNKTATGLLPHDYALLTDPGHDEDTDEHAQPEVVTDCEPSPSS